MNFDPDLNKRRVLGGILSSIVGHQWATSEDQRFLSRISLELYCLHCAVVFVADISGECGKNVFSRSLIV